MNCQECGAEINTEDAFCGECGHKITAPPDLSQSGSSQSGSPQPDPLQADPPPAGPPKVENNNASRFVYPLGPVILTVAVLVVILYGQFLTGIYMKFDFLIIGGLVGLSTGLYIHLKKVKLSDRKFHSFSVFFVTAMGSILAVEFLIMLFHAAEIVVLNGPIFIFGGIAAAIVGLLAVGIPHIMGKKPT